jgi:hypothetical protein
LHLPQLYNNKYLLIALRCDKLIKNKKNMQALVLAEGLLLVTGSASGCRVWFWPQGLVLATVFNIFYKLLMLVISNSFIIYILILISKISF